MRILPRIRTSKFPPIIKAKTISTAELYITAVVGQGEVVSSHTGYVQVKSNNIEDGKLIKDAKFDVFVKIASDEKKALQREYDVLGKLSTLPRDCILGVPKFFALFEFDKKCGQAQCLVQSPRPEGELLSESNRTISTKQR